MLPVWWLVAAVLAAMILTASVASTMSRLDRLHARVDAALATLDTQLVRRAAAVRHWLETGPERPDRAAALELTRQALAGPFDGSGVGPERERRENDVGHLVRSIASTPAPAGRAEALDEVREAAVRVVIARRFFNDAVRDARALRSRRLPRVLHLAGARAMPDFFDIDDSVPDPPSREDPHR